MIFRVGFRCVFCGASWSRDEPSTVSTRVCKECEAKCTVVEGSATFHVEPSDPREAIVPAKFLGRPEPLDIEPEYHDHPERRSDYLSQEE